MIYLYMSVCLSIYIYYISIWGAAYLLFGLTLTVYM